MEATHTPTCEVNRPGDHGPCSCGRDAEMRRERLASLTTTAAVEDMIARYLQGETTDTLDAIRSLARQRDALRNAIEPEVRHECQHPRCLRLRAALEVR